MSIVYQKDWAKYPNAIADFNTRNQYFVKYCKLLYDMGIKHWYFPLALTQPALSGLSPYDENLTEEQKSAMLHECDINPWWYLRELVVDAKGGITLEDKQYRANRGNIAAMWLLLACIDYFQIQPRQTGKSYGTDSNSNWLLYFKYRDTDLNIVTKGEKTRISNVKRLKMIRDAWPSWICRMSNSDDNNQSTLSCNYLNNKIYTHVSQASPKNAGVVGRGLTSPYLQLDEMVVIDNLQTMLNSASGGTNTARELARRKGHPYCTIFTSTAGDNTTTSGEFAYDIWMSATPMDELFYDAADRDELVKMIMANGKSLTPIVNLTYNHRQLGYTDEWFFEAVGRARGKGHDIDKDYFNIWGSGGEESLIDKDTLRVIKNSEIEPVSKEISKQNYIFRMYEEYSPEGSYVLAMDSSDAIGRDDIGMVLINTYTGSVAAACMINESSLALFCEWLLELLVSKKNILFIPENKLNAQVIIDYLALKLPEYGEDPFYRIYNKIVANPELHEQAFNEVRNTNHMRSAKLYEKNKKYFGFKTDGAKRSFLYGTVLNKAIDDTADRIRDLNVIKQLASLREVKGRIDHGSGGHDDMVIAWLLCHWVLNYGTNLKLFGLNVNKILKDKYNRPDTASTPQSTNYKEMYSDIAKEHVEELLERLKNTTNRVEVNLLEKQIRRRQQDILETDDDSLKTIDQIIQKAKENNDARFATTEVANRRSGRALINKYGRQGLRNGYILP